MPNALTFNYDAINPAQKAGLCVFVIPEFARDVFLGVAHRLYWKSSWYSPSEQTIDDDFLHALVAETEACFMSGTNLDDILAVMQSNNVIFGEIRDALIASDGEGGFLDIAEIFFRLLPILLAGNATQETLAEYYTLGSFATDLTSSGGSSNAFEDYVNACCGDGKVAESVENGYARTAGQASFCYDLGSASPLTNPEIDATLTDEGSGVWAVVPDGGATRQRFDLDNVVAGVYDLTMEIQFLDGAATANPSYRNGGAVVHDFGFVGDGVYTTQITVAENDDPQLFIQNPNGYAYDLTLDLCVSAPAISNQNLPLVAAHLNGGIGQVSGGNIFRRAGEWFNVPALVDPVTIDLELDPLPDLSAEYRAFQLDWTRPIDATMSIQLYNGTSLVHTDSISADVGRAGSIIVSTVSDAWDNAKLTITSVAEQSFADLIVWAYRLNDS